MQERQELKLKPIWKDWSLFFPERLELAKALEVHMYTYTDSMPVVQNVKEKRMKEAEVKEGKKKKKNENIGQFVKQNLKKDICKKLQQLNVNNYEVYKE